MHASPRGDTDSLDDEKKVSLIQVLLHLLDGRKDVQGLFTKSQGHPQVSCGESVGATVE